LASSPFSPPKGWDCLTNASPRGPANCWSAACNLAFAALASGPGTDLKVLATGLGFGILLDATIVRSVLVPSLVSLFGRWNWMLPDSVARIMRVEPSHPHPEREPAPVGD